jgi:hypothetical protein
MRIVLVKIAQLFEKIVFETEYDQPKHEAEEEYHGNVDQHKKQQPSEALCGQDASFCEDIKEPRSGHEGKDERNPH